MTDDAKSRIQLFPLDLFKEVQSHLGSNGFPKFHEHEFKKLFWIIFTSRVGSTHLAFRMQQEFEVGFFGEEFNLRALKEGPVSHLKQRISEIAWCDHWCCKSGEEGVLVAEHLGIVQPHLSNINFCFLYRESIIDQAVSLTRAAISGKWFQFQNDELPTESEATALNSLAVSVEAKANAIEYLNIIVSANNRLLRWLRSLSVPYLVSNYEANLADDYQALFRKIEQLGLKARNKDDDHDLRHLRNIEPQIQRDDFNELLKEALTREFKDQVLHYEELHRQFIVELNNNS